MSIVIIISNVKKKMVAKNFKVINFNFYRSIGNLTLKKKDKYHIIKIFVHDGRIKEKFKNVLYN